MLSMNGYPSWTPLLMNVQPLIFIGISLRREQWGGPLGQPVYQGRMR
jgi:hypothetical protein